jgi:hypothetical protein
MGANPLSGSANAGRLEDGVLLLRCAAYLSPIRPPREHARAPAVSSAAPLGGAEP